jgi:hypothetical protein
MCQISKGGEISNVMREEARLGPGEPFPERKDDHFSRPNLT